MATLAPTIGPTVGGYLTDLFNWHWLFLVNVPIGIAAMVAVATTALAGMPFERTLDQSLWPGTAPSRHPARRSSS